MYTAIALFACGPIRDIGVTLMKKPRTMPGLESFALNAAAVVRGC
jgi:hypothetical protein